jgi:glycosyltransferase involved in cell wall biosynthesis
MLMHTTPVDENGTDLPKVAEHLMPDANIIFAPNRYTETELNYLYNLADVTINLASNEGFGLATAESVMAGTPIIVTVTGGLQDQCGFREKGSGKLLTADDYVEIGSLHDKYKKNTHVWGDWVTPTWPVRSTTGSVPTPYIFDDRVDFQDVAPLIRGWYDMGREERKKMGLKGRKHFMSEGKLSREAMCNALVEGMEGAFANWKPIKKYNLIKL